MGIAKLDGEPNQMEYLALTLDTHFRLCDEDNAAAVEVIEGKVTIDELAADPRTRWSASPMAHC